MDCEWCQRHTGDSSKNLDATYIKDFYTCCSILLIVVYLSSTYKYKMCYCYCTFYDIKNYKIY